MIMTHFSSKIRNSFSSLILVAAVNKVFAAVEQKISRDSRKNSRIVQKVVAAWSKN